MSERPEMSEADLSKNIPPPKPPESKSLEAAPAAPRAEIKKPAKKLAPMGTRAEDPPSPQEERRRQVHEAMKPFLEDVGKMMGRSGKPVQKTESEEERRRQVHEAMKPFLDEVKVKLGSNEAPAPKQASVEKEKKPGFWKRLFGGGKKSS